MLSRLQKLAEEWNLAVYVTNQMTADPGAGLTFVPDPKKVRPGARGGDAQLFATFVCQ
jgi:hypothetical protein